MAVIGGHVNCQVASESSVAGITTVTKECNGEGAYSTVLFMYQNGRLIAKTQSGL